jgi:hypothetical protein
LDFLTNNTNIDGFISIWKHINAPSTLYPSPFYENFLYNYTNDYTTFNILGAADGIFSGEIASGQSFFVSMLDSYTSPSNVTFINSLRRDTHAVFYKNGGDSRLWLDYIDTHNNAKRTLIGYSPNATNGKDRLYDAETNTSAMIFSILDGKPYTIQGKTFSQQDKFHLGINAIESGEYKIGINSFDGLFFDNNIYLEDTYLKVIHNLKESPYVFNSEAGIFNDRFIIKYLKTPLGDVKNIKVYNLLGALLYDNITDIKQIEAKNQILILVITMENNSTVVRKIIQN